jgi:WD40 repeat protein
MPGEATRFWLANPLAITEWDRFGRTTRTVFKDTAVMEMPACMQRLGNDVVVVSEDKASVLVLDEHGVLLRSFSSPDLEGATDCVFGADGLLYVSSRLHSSSQPGLVSVWDVSKAPSEGDAKAIRYEIAPETYPHGTTWITSLAFDADGDLLVTEFARGRVERWSTKTHAKLEVLLDSGAPATYKEIERGPDGLIYVAGMKGVFRFEASAHSDGLADLAPFFDAGSLAGRYKHDLSASDLVFVPGSALEPATGR